MVDPETITDEAQEPGPGEQAPEAQPSDPDELFAEDPEDEPEDDEGGLFDEEAAGSEDEEKPDEGEKDGTKEASAPRENRIPEPRFKRVVRERNELRAESERLTKEIGAAKPLAEALNRHYGKYVDPLQAFENDVRWLEALEAMRDVPDVKRALLLVQQKVTKGDTVETTEKKQPESQSDAAVQRLLRRDAKRTAEGVLSKHGLKEWVSRQIVESLLADSTVDLAELDERAVVRHARSFLRDRGIPAEDALARRPAKANGAEAKETPKAKPPAGGSAKAATAERKIEPGAKKDERQSAKTMTEWERSHSERAELAIRGLLSQPEA